jgi:CheY-like chemotaxis protein
MVSSGELDGLRVLVVEDEVLVSMVIEDMLAGFGCQVVGPAGSVREALALIDAARIDGALLDVNLGGERLGFRVADALVSRGIPFVFASGYGRSILTRPHLDVPVLSKPFDETMLRQALQGLARRQPT